MIANYFPRLLQGMQKSFPHLSVPQWYLDFFIVLINLTSGCLYLFVLIWLPCFSSCGVFSKRLNLSGTVVTILSTGKIRSWVKCEAEFPGNLKERRGKGWGIAIDSTTGNNQTRFENLKRKVDKTHIWAKQWPRIPFCSALQLQILRLKIFLSDLYVKILGCAGWVSCGGGKGRGCGVRTTQIHFWSTQGKFHAHYGTQAYLTTGCLKHGGGPFHVIPLAESLVHLERKKEYRKSKLGDISQYRPHKIHSETLKWVLWWSPAFLGTKWTWNKSVIKDWHHREGGK